MELDDLKTRWQEYDQKLDASVRLNTRLLRQSLLGRTESALRRFTPSIVVSLILDGIALLWLGSFIGDHRSEPRFLVPAIALHLFTIALMGVTIHQWVTLRGIDFDGPVLDVQKKVELLRIREILMTKWIAFLAPLLWVPLLIVTAKAFFGFDVYALPQWLAANFAFGVAFIPLMVWISRRFARRAGPRMQRLMDDIAGPSLNAARRFLREASRFEEDDRIEN